MNQKAIYEARSDEAKQIIADINTRHRQVTVDL